MATPIKERMRKMRERRQAEGMVRVEVVLPRELLERCRLPGETINACLQRALLQSVSGNTLQHQPTPVSGDKASISPPRHVSGSNLPRKAIPVSGNTEESSLAVSGNQRKLNIPGTSSSTPTPMPVSGDSRDTIIHWLIVAKDAMRLSYRKLPMR